MLRWSYYLLWAVLIAVYVVPSLGHLDGYLWDYDEGPQVQAAALAHEGYPLYSRIVVNKPPLLTWWLELAFSLGGVQLTSARAAILVLTTAGFIFLGLLGELWWGWGGGLLALGLYLLVPEISVRAGVVMNELPALAAAAASMWAATHFHTSGRRIWVVVSAACFVVALLFHPLLSFTAVPLAIILYRPITRPISFKEDVLNSPLVLFGGLTLLLFALSLIPVNKAGLARWVYHYNTAPLEVQGLTDDAATRGFIVDYLREHVAVVVLAIAATIATAWLNRQSRFWLVVGWAWFGGTIATLYVMRPLWEHYLLLLLFPLILVSGGGLQAALHRLASGKSAATLALIGVAVGGLLAWRAAGVRLEWPSWPAPQAAARDYLVENVPPDAFVVSDDQFLAFASGHLVPPELADTSFKRIFSDYLETEDVLHAIARYEVKYSVWATERFEWLEHLRDRLAGSVRDTTCFEDVCVYTLESLPAAP